MWTGARLLAAILLAIAGAAGVWRWLQAAPLPEDASAAPLYAAAALCGFWAGWGPLGRRLGGGFRRSAAFALGAAGAGFLWFCVVVAVNATLGLFRFQSTNSIYDVVVRFGGHVIDTGQIAFADPKVVATVLGLAAFAGLFAERADHVWR